MIPLLSMDTLLSIVVVFFNSLVPFLIRLVSAEAQVPAMFVFGDSLLDPGNNNNLATLAKANYFPNGIDFPQGVTGRYCNGATVADYMSNYLGLPLIPAYNKPVTVADDMLQGVNFASAAAGILNDTGKVFGDRFSMDSQIQNFKRVLKGLSSVLVNGTVLDHIGKSLFFVSIGSNDYINNFLLPVSQTASRYTPESYAELLAHEYSRQLKELYELGGRKFLVGGLGPLGCIPNQIGIQLPNSSYKCVESTNSLAMQFNAKLEALIADLNRRLPGSCFLFWDIYGMSMEVITNYSKYGFEYPLTACCGAGRAKGQIICLPVLQLECRNRSRFIFWDPYHPTDRFNSIAAQMAYNGTLQASFPMNAMQLALM